MRYHLLTGCALAGLISAGAIAPASAQSANQAAPQSPIPTQTVPVPNIEPPEAATVGEIIVTANKRAENVQDVPAAVQAISGGELRAKTIVEFTDLAKVAREACPSRASSRAPGPIRAG